MLREERLLEEPRVYLERKRQEIALLNSCLEEPLHLEPPSSIEAVVEHKFRLAGALKAQHALRDWAFTETAWSDPRQFPAGPFKFDFDYQRADLRVDAPPIYPLCGTGAQANETAFYTCSGMSALATLLLALERLTATAEVIAFPGSYSETLELLERHGRNVRLRKVANANRIDNPTTPSVLLIDACLTQRDFNAILRLPAETFALIMFDTTGFWTRSAPVRQVVHWSLRAQVPIALVRSHTKLDSLGVEYGRLGSIVLRCPAQAGKHAGFPPCEATAAEISDVLRLLGGAAIPAHFPPFMGTDAADLLGRKRLAVALRNSRSLASRLRSAFPDGMAQRDFAHQLYVALTPSHDVDESAARHLAGELCSDLKGRHLPIRHAGSFGFDFAAAEWFFDSLLERYGVRIAVPDLPTLMWERLSEAIVNWWKHCR
jgi:hypothetical protein